MNDYTKLMAGLGLSFGGFVFLGLMGYPLELILQSLGLLGIGAGGGCYLTRTTRWREK